MMKVHFSDELYDAQLLRVLGHAYYGGADIGECLSTVEEIEEHDNDGWFRQWWMTAERVERAAEESLRAGHTVSAREALLRASSYYRIAYIFLFGTTDDGRLARAYDKQAETFRRAGALFDPPFEEIAIPFEGSSMHGYFFRAAAGIEPRPTLILTGGYDSTAEEAYLFNAAAAARRGYNCICYDGPGQGHALVHQGLKFRANWESVVSPVVDYLLTRSDVDPRRIVLTGLSFGGYLAPRAASREHRIAALIADPGQYDLFAAIGGRIPGPLAAGIDGHGLRAALLRRILRGKMRHPTEGWAIRRGIWTHGVADPIAYIRETRAYSVRGLAADIQCPALICAAENDDISAQADELFDALTGRKSLLRFTSAEGAGEHCEDGNRSLFHQRMFDWLDEVLEIGRRRAVA